MNDVEAGAGLGVTAAEEAVEEMGASAGATCCWGCCCCVWNELLDALGEMRAPSAPPSFPRSSILCRSGDLNKTQ